MVKLSKLVMMAAGAINCAALILPWAFAVTGIWELIYIIPFHMNTSPGKKVERQTQKHSLPRYERSLRRMYQSYGISM